MAVVQEERMTIRSRAVVMERGGSGRTGTGSGWRVGPAGGGAVWSGEVPEGMNFMPLTHNVPLTHKFLIFAGSWVRSLWQPRESGVRRHRAFLKFCREGKVVSKSVINEKLPPMRGGGTVLKAY